MRCIWEAPGLLGRGGQEWGGESHSPSILRGSLSLQQRLTRERTEPYEPALNSELSLSGTGQPLLSWLPSPVPSLPPASPGWAGLPH